ncbi:MAG: cysteine synthase family protein [Planctomycetes bacterium]|nr:cysteine synthase family protein [Planctomycetota bacterium]
MNTKDNSARTYGSVFDMLPDEDNPTPLVRINHLNPAPGFELWGKLEWMNPFGSVKDRAAWAMLRQLEERGEVTKDRGIVEPTSGNTGISLAGLASARGYHMRAIVPNKVPMEKKVLLRIFGAELDVMNDNLCPSPGMGEGAIGMARSYAKAMPNKYVMPNQYENVANREAHEQTTGPEIWRQTQGRITHLFVSLGTCGTVSGLSRYLKAKNPAIKVVAVQPSEGHDVPGLRNISELHVSKLFDPALIDEILEVDFNRAYSGALALCRREGLMAGPSSGLILEGARDVLTRDKPASGLGVAIFCDSILKYVSSMIKHLPELAVES